MKIDLILPPEFAKQIGQGERLPLALATEHPASSYGLGVLLNPQGKIIDGAAFRYWRKLGARIETDSPAKVCAALGVPEGEPGIEEIP